MLKKATFAKIKLDLASLKSEVAKLKSAWSRLNNLKADVIKLDNTKLQMLISCWFGKTWCCSQQSCGKTVSNQLITKANGVENKNSWHNWN